MSSKTASRYLAIFPSHRSVKPAAKTFARPSATFSTAEPFFSPLPLTILDLVSEDFTYTCVDTGEIDRRTFVST
ncbi:hypothetical protein JTE90_022111 [Oedothorax gibbosus]|uniref:Uncharacterized protein n=1 Tax=Oedothorax gibbosus TaxID=931172 RepID=A0AAV6VSJ9_9ARAC|nr:hypothetical protein JTE90_022111 [Oedothorax gibbosus]